MENITTRGARENIPQEGVRGRIPLGGEGELSP